MRLLTSSAFVVSMICSWAVVGVLACKNNNIFTKRAPPENDEGKFTGNPSGNCIRSPPWMSMQVEGEVIHTQTGHVMELSGEYLKKKNPVVKVIYAKNEDKCVVVFIMMPNKGEDEKYKQQKGDTMEYYLAKYQIYSQHGSNAQKPDETGMPRLVRKIWKFRPDEGLPLPPPSPHTDTPEIPVGSHPLSPPEMEEVILAHKFESLWENEEAKYYKFPDKPYALKVSRIAGALELLSFIIQTSNTRKAGHLVDAATLKISSKEEKYISYLLVDFPGKMEKQMQVDLEPDEKAKFQQDAIERYRTHYNMINMRISDNYFVYDMTKKMAYIYDWSIARHADLPKVTLTEICRPTSEKMKDIKKNLAKETFVRQFYAQTTPTS